MKFFKLLRLVRARLRRRFGVAPLAQAMPDLQAWWESPLGQAFLDEQKRLLDVQLQDLFGFYLIQMGVDPSQDLTQSSRIGHRINLWLPGSGQATGFVPTTTGTSRLSPLVTELHQLPLPDESVDLVVLHHLLDFSQRPHQILREVQRVLIPRGQVIVIGFNPRSFWGLLGRVLSLFRSRPLWRRQNLPMHRLKDWCHLLDLELVSFQRGFYQPPIQHKGLLKGMKCLNAWGAKFNVPGGGFYLIQACKQVTGAIAVRPDWETETRPLSSFGVNPLRRCKPAEESKKIHD